MPTSIYKMVDSFPAVQYENAQMFFEIYWNKPATMCLCTINVSVCAVSESCLCTYSVEGTLLPITIAISDLPLIF